MNMRNDLLETLCCPVSKSRLKIMTPHELEALNTAVARGEARYASGDCVDGPLEGGLTASDGTSAYGIRDGVPVLLPEQRILCSGGAPGTDHAQPRDREGQASAKQWERLSLIWDQIRPPLRPVLQDIELFERLVGEGLAEAGSPRPRVLLLGVTPEIATMVWPAGTQLLAADSSEAMIRHVWPGRAVRNGLAVRADWKTLPVGDAACDVVLGDGSINVPPYPEDFFALVREVRRVLQDGGLFALRMFARPEQQEPIEAIFADLRGGRIGNLDIFRWRLAMALQKDLAIGARLCDVWEAWQANVPHPVELMRSLGWPPEQLQVQIDRMRGLEVRVTFPTVRELAEALAPEFVQTACHFPDYESGDRYPTVAFKARPR